MSNVVFVHAGQCGNQLGYEMLESLFNHTSDDETNECDMYFRKTTRNKSIARCVCLDTEPKAVSISITKAQRNGKWTFDKSSAAYRHGGAGNNWGIGYMMCSGEFLDISLNAIRRELEMCDMPTTIILIQSIGGGTGSGLGTRMTEACNEEFSDVSRLNIAVAPYHFSEVVVQHYNSLLCLSKISASSDGVIVFENEVADDLCKVPTAQLSIFQNSTVLPSTSVTLT